MIVLSGYYGFSNFGDDLFPIACKKVLVFRTQKIRFLSPLQDDLDGLCMLPKYVQPFYKHRIWGRALRSLAMVRVVVQASLLVLAGGSTLSSNTSRYMRRLEFFLSSFGFFRIAAIGVSVGPFFSEKDRVFYRKYIERLQFLVVRDDASVHEVEELGLIGKAARAADLVGVLRTDILATPAVKKSRVRKRIGVSICRYEELQDPASNVDSGRFRSLLESLTEMHENYDCDFCILSLNADDVIGDNQISRNFASQLSSYGLDAFSVDYKSPWESISLIKSFDAFVSFRLHGAIVAYLAEIPFVLVEYHKKCGDFLTTIGYCSSCRIKDSQDSSEYSKSITGLLDNIATRISLPPAEYEHIANFNFDPFDFAR